MRKYKRNNTDLIVKSTQFEHPALIVNCDLVVLVVAEKRLEFNVKKDIDKYNRIIINGVEFIKADLL